MRIFSLPFLPEISHEIQPYSYGGICSKTLTSTFNLMERHMHVSTKIIVAHRKQLKPSIEKRGSSSILPESQKIIEVQRRQ